MTDKLRAAAQQALEALEEADSRDEYRSYGLEITALRTALAEQPAEQEPVAWVGLSEDDKLEILRTNGEAAVMYLTEAKLREKNAEQPAEQEPEGSVCGRCGGLVFDPVLPQPAKQPLTDEAVIDLIPSTGIRSPIDAMWFARAIERAHGINVPSASGRLDAATSKLSWPMIPTPQPAEPSSALLLRLGGT